MNTFKCPICGNDNPIYVGYKNDKPYCRKCIKMRGESAPNYVYSGATPLLKLNYELSKEQKDLSQKIVSSFINKVNTLITAICGAGKTELVYGVIYYALTQRKSIAFALPRRDVAIELFERIKDAFPNNNVVAVYGGHTSELLGDIVILTTHQLYRYEKYFDLMILDEIDAFPYNGDELLSTMFFRALKGNYVFMSATPPEDVLNKFKKEGGVILELNKRFHRHPLPVPEVKILYGDLKVDYLKSLLKTFIKEKKPVFVFVPTIEIGEELFKRLKPTFDRCNIVHSKNPNRPQIISDFRHNKYDFLVTTAVLERGVTVKNLQVIIYQSDHQIYNDKTLIQISGRVGRKKDAPEGKVIFLSDKKTSHMEKAIRDIETKNLYL